MTTEFQQEKMLRGITAKRCIVLVSGWSGSKSDFYWGPFRNKWKKEGYDVVQAAFPHRGFGNIHASANAVEQVLEAIRPQYSLIVFVGHSMGGLIGRYLIQKKERTDLIDAYVSLGTPHKGTVIAKYAKYLPFSVSAQQMSSESEFLKRLNEAPWPSQTPALALQGQFEQLVFPHSNAEFEHAENVRIAWADHVGLIFVPQTFGEIYSWLTYDVLDESGVTNREGNESRLVFDTN